MRVVERVKGGTEGSISIHVCIYIWIMLCPCLIQAPCRLTFGCPKAGVIGYMLVDGKASQICQLCFPKGYM